LNPVGSPETPAATIFSLTVGTPKGPAGVRKMKLRPSAMLSSLFAPLEAGIALFKPLGGVAARSFFGRRSRIVQLGALVRKLVLALKQS
jgi:hypothetical protein